MAAPVVEQQADRNFASLDDPLPSSHASPSPNQKSRYAALFDDIPSPAPPTLVLNWFSPSQPTHRGLTNTASLPDYKSLREEWNIISTDFDERMRWLDNLEERYDHINAYEFLTWMRENPEPRLIQAQRVINTEFVRLLQTVDWIQNNEDLGTVNERLWSPHISVKPDLYIGRYKDTVLKLRLNGLALNPPKADIATCKSYGITSLYQRSLLAIRYKSLGEDGPGKMDFLFVTLGNICLSDTRDSEWDNTNLLLILEVQSSGKRGGFYVLCDSDNYDRDHIGEPFPQLLDTTEFTLAKVTSADVNLQELYSAIPTTIDLVAMSRSTLEIAEIGIKGDWSANNSPIPLFFLNNDCHGEFV